MLSESLLRTPLTDDNTELGGISFVGETLADFISEAGLNKELSLSEVNEALKSCGIKPLVNDRSQLNTICLDCKCLNVTCMGTTNMVWTGCIYKER